MTSIVRDVLSPTLVLVSLKETLLKGPALSNGRATTPVYI